MLGTFVLVWVNAFSLGGPGSGEIYVKGVYPSPTGSLVATAYTVSGGGAAGYVYEVVNIRRTADPFDCESGVVFVTTDAGAKVAWTGNDALSINGPGTASAITKLSSWGEDGRVHIEYAGG